MATQTSEIATQSTIQPLYSLWERYRVRFTTVVVCGLIIEDIIEGTQPLNFLKNPWGFAGLLLVLCGVGMRSWAAGFVQKSTKLATQGPYSITRHPLYLGSLLLVLGFCTIVGDVENIVIGLLVGVLFYLPTIFKEEKFLSQTFGEKWTAYKQQTGLFYPRRLPSLFSCQWSFRQWLDNREYQASVTSLLVLVVLGIFTHFA